MSKICPQCERVFEDEHIFCAADGTALRSQQGGDDLIGSVVDDRYVIKSLLGEGGMGRVFLGQHIHLPRQVAIKVLHEKLHSDPAAVARFNREASNASRIEHERVARVFDFGRMAGGATYLAMEYIEGRTLSAILDAEGALEPNRVVRLVEQIAAGLTAAHQLGIVHRDLKPDNVMLMTGPQGAERVKIVDFGIAKTVGDPEAGTLTAPGFVTGTPEYMAPEQLLGQTLDGRCDVYALGLLTFKALTSRMPFDPPTPERGFSSPLMDTPRRLSDVRPDLPWTAGQQRVFDRVLARSPDDRYATALEFSAALQQALTTPTITAPAASVTRTPVVVFSAHDTSGARVDAPGVQAATSVPASSAPPIAREASRTATMAGGVVVVLALLGGGWWWSQRGPEGALQPSGDSSSVTNTQGAGATTAASPDTASALASTPASTPPATPPATPPIPAPPSNAPPVPTNSAPTSAPTSAPSTSSTGAVTNAVTLQLDAIRDELDALLLADETRETSARALALVTRLDQVLKIMPPATDSARGLLLKANLFKLAGQRERACSTLDAARPLATATADRNSVRRNSDLWSCRAP